MGRGDRGSGGGGGQPLGQAMKGEHNDGARRETGVGKEHAPVNWHGQWACLRQTKPTCPPPSLPLASRLLGPSDLYNAIYRVLE